MDLNTYYIFIIHLWLSVTPQMVLFHVSSGYEVSCQFCQKCCPFNCQLGCSAPCRERFRSCGTGCRIISVTATERDVTLWLRLIVVISNRHFWQNSITNIDNYKSKHQSRLQSKNNIIVQYCLVMFL